MPVSCKPRRRTATRVSYKLKRITVPSPRGSVRDTNPFRLGWRPCRSCVRMYSRMIPSSRPTVETKSPRTQKCWPTKLHWCSHVDPSQMNRTLPLDETTHLRDGSLFEGHPSANVQLLPPPRQSRGLPTG